MIDASRSSDLSNDHTKFTDFCKIFKNIKIWWKVYNKLCPRNNKAKNFEKTAGKHLCKCLFLSKSASKKVAVNGKTIIQK